MMDFRETDKDDPVSSPSRKENSSSTISNAIVKSKLGSILPEQITTNFLTNTNTKVMELDPADIEKGKTLKVASYRRRAKYFVQVPSFEENLICLETSLTRRQC